MDRGAKTIVHEVARVGHNLATTLPPPETPLESAPLLCPNSPCWGIRVGHGSGILSPIGKSQTLPGLQPSTVVSDSLRPQGLQHARLPCPSPTPRVYSD